MFDVLPRNQIKHSDYHNKKLELKSNYALLPNPEKFKLTACMRTT